MILARAAALVRIQVPGRAAALVQTPVPAAGLDQVLGLDQAPALVPGRVLGQAAVLALDQVPAQVPGLDQAALVGHPGQADLPGQVEVREPAARAAVLAALPTINLQT
ncbi:MAG: hypothetical protein ABI690_04605 [Chloroflexota bacterium]